AKGGRVEGPGSGAVARHQHHFRFRYFFFEGTQYAVTVSASQHHVAEHDGPGRFVKALKRIFSRRGLGHVPTLSAQNVRDKLADVMLVVDNERLKVSIRCCCCSFHEFELLPLRSYEVWYSLRSSANRAFHVCVAGVNGS